MLIGAIDKLTVALSKKRLSTPTFQTTLSRFIYRQVYIDNGLISCNCDTNRPKHIHSSYTKRYTRRLYLPHADIFHRINRREAKLQIFFARVWCVASWARCAISMSRPKRKRKLRNKTPPAKVLNIEDEEFFGRLD